MATTYLGWVADGRPWRNCQPIVDFIAVLRGHGYTGPGSGIGDQSHLTANPPEDHCPYSHTPWPGTQPYPYVMAIDIMPGCGVDIIDLGGRLFNDKMSNKAGTQPIKYINWTDSDGNCFHDSWMPNHTRFASTDRGHIHVSFRTDYVTSNAMSQYSPYGGGGDNTIAGEDMTPEQAEQLQAVYDAIFHGGSSTGAPVPTTYDTAGNPTGHASNSLVAKLDTLLKTPAASVELTPEQVAQVSAAAHDGAAGAIDGATISGAVISTAV